MYEQRYVTNVSRITEAIYNLRDMLIKVWKEACQLESSRITGIQNLYEEIVKSNQTIYGIDVQKQLLHLRDRFKNSELFSVKGLLREKELEAMVTLCYQCHRFLDFNQASVAEVQDFLSSVKLEK